LTVIECPKCGSKFKIEKDILAKESIKMRCSVCSLVFSYTPEEKGSPENDFDLLIGTNDGELQEKPLQDDLSRSLSEGMPSGTAPSEITESMEEEKEEGEQAQQKSPGDEIEPESVIREIDTILGSSEAVSGEEEKPLAMATAKGLSFKAKAAMAIAALALVVVAILGARIFLPALNKNQKELEAPVLERGPFFNVPDGSVTYEILTNDNEGAVLVVKGVIKKLTSKPLKSILVEARVYDQANTLMESRSAYAGIVPESSELMRQKGSEIDSLLTAEPRTLGVLETSQDIPFAVAFFGKSAREGTSFKVEVKEFHWK
jgi:predicted Zn finger-like uncharacterized protein